VVHFSPGAGGPVFTRRRHESPSRAIFARSRCRTQASVLSASTPRAPVVPRPCAPGAWSPSAARCRRRHHDGRGQSAEARGARGGVAVGGGTRLAVTLPLSIRNRLSVTLRRWEDLKGPSGSAPLPLPEVDPWRRTARLAAIAVRSRPRCGAICPC
jgi:hypothetical protein